MKSSEKLLSLKYKRLEVFKNPNGVCVCYQNAEVKDGYFLIGEYGTGKDFESACDDYYNKISGKTIVFNAESSSRKEITVL